MPFVLPTFNLTANVWHAFTPMVSTYSAPDGDFGCNLSPGKRGFVQLPPLSGLTYSYFPMELLCPPGTNVNAEINGGHTPADVVECPAGSQRFYWVSYVDDVGKGFSNEHRLVMCNMFFSRIDFSDVSFDQPKSPLP